MPQRKQYRSPAFQRAIDAAGGLGQFCRKLGISPQAVTAWRHGIPAHHVRKIERITRGAVKAHELRPDVFTPVAP